MLDWLVLAEVAPPRGTPVSFLAQIMPFVLVFAIMYFLLIRPQQKKAKEHREMVGRLKAGDQVITSGGIHGTIAQVDERAVKVRIAENVEVEVSRGAIASVADRESA